MSPSKDIKSEKPKFTNDVGQVEPEVTVTCKWKIDKNLIDGSKTGDKLISPVIRISDTKHCVIWIYPRYNSEEAKDYVSVYVKSVKGDFEACISLYFLCNGEKRNLHRGGSHNLSFKATHSGWGYEHFQEHRFLDSFSTTDYSSTGPKRIITICCDLTIKMNIKRGPLFELEYETRLAEFDDFEKLIDNKESSDVILSMNEEELHAHKSILAIKSPVFAAMFTHNMKENQQGLVKIEDVTSETMRELLRFIYVGKINNLENIAMDLCAAADKYSIEKLKSIYSGYRVKFHQIHTIKTPGHSCILISMAVESPPLEKASNSSIGEDISAGPVGVNLMFYSRVFYGSKE
ncbi:hypothetical protein QAD02_014894 [Eretmocerus hayati]|uniref:Uncharacterized protein n=1 Tax=Eretmocerus hayati TaxID=131215 RepID=A0ACC2P9I2_9HYME|nr:hypothetical protein QAD02_014894 [Eretmocerus hayati]